MNCYRIRHWNEKYECNRTRDHKKLDWFACPIKLDGDGYTLIAELPDGSKRPDGAAIFGAWMACVQVAARCQPRGTFIQSNGNPHNAASLSRKTRLPVEIISLMLDFCLNQCKWLEIIRIDGDEISIDAKIPQGCAKTPHVDAKKPPYITLHNSTEHKTPGAGAPVDNKNLGNKIKNGIDLGNGKSISWSFFQKIVNIAADRYQATLIIYRSKDKDEPEGWILDGLKKPQMYALLPCKDEEDNPTKVKNWIDEKINKYDLKKENTALTIFREKMAEIEKSL